MESEELMETLFLRLPYKIKTKFVALSNTGINQGTFSQLRELVEDAAAETDSRFGKLLHQKKRSSKTTTVWWPQSFQLCNKACYSVYNSKKTTSS